MRQWALFNKWAIKRILGLQITEKQSEMEVLSKLLKKPEEIQRLKNYLYSLGKDEHSDFTQEVKKLADEIHFELTQIEDNSSMTQINRDNARGWQTKVTGDRTQIGEFHQHGFNPNTPQQ